MLLIKVSVYLLTDMSQMCLMTRGTFKERPHFSERVSFSVFLDFLLLCKQIKFSRHANSATLSKTVKMVTERNLNYIAVSSFAQETGQTPA